jgi:hypothetical protein
MRTYTLLFLAMSSLEHTALLVEAQALAPLATLSPADKAEIELLLRPSTDPPVSLPTRDAPSLAPLQLSGLFAHYPPFWAGTDERPACAVALFVKARGVYSADLPLYAQLAAKRAVLHSDKIASNCAQFFASLTQVLGIRSLCPSPFSCSPPLPTLFSPCRAPHPRGRGCCGAHCARSLLQPR